MQFLKNLNPKIKIFTALLIIAVIFIIVTFTFAIQFSSFAVGIAKYVLALGILILVDKFFFHEINTMEILKDNGVAYAIFFLANAIMVVGCIATS